MGEGLVTSYVVLALAYLLLGARIQGGSHRQSTLRQPLTGQHRYPIDTIELNRRTSLLMLAPLHSVFALCMTLAAALLAITNSVRAEEAARIFETYKDRIVQVRLIDRTTDAKAGIGSGFRVSPRGHIVTNFHVVAELIYNPQQYYAEYLMDNGTKGNLELRAIDVIHDLALMKTNEDTADYLTLEARDPRKGDRLYAFGNPHDLGLTIIEGTYNGLMEKSIYDKIHFTGSVNPGMSGGPTINDQGRVIGVNVATAGNQLSFLVPVKYVSTLLENASKDLEQQSNFTLSARNQLLDNQENYINQLLSTPFEQVEMQNYLVPGQLASFLSCWGDTQQNDGALYEWAYQSCSTSDDLFLSENQSSGAISFTHEFFNTKELDPIRFYGFLQRRFQAFRPHQLAEENMVTNFDCEASIVEHNQIQSKAVFCLRAYKLFDGLFDTFMKISSLTHADAVLQSTLTIAGVSFKNAMQLSGTFLNSIRWKN